jgi:RecQ family ATP-dependent DNA helicase
VGKVAQSSTPPRPGPAPVPTFAVENYGTGVVGKVAQSSTPPRPGPAPVPTFAVENYGTGVVGKVARTGAPPRSEPAQGRIFAIEDSGTGVVGKVARTGAPPRSEPAPVPTFAAENNGTEVAGKVARTSAPPRSEPAPVPTFAVENYGTEVAGKVARTGAPPRSEPAPVPTFAVENYGTEVVGKVARTGAPPRSEPAPVPTFAEWKRAEGRGEARPNIPVLYSGTPQELLQKAFGFERFRANQEAVCQAVIDGHDALLVMPTGAGKSLCYQLPGIARGGTTLVISPLIALMEDQAGKLKERGFSVERIHSGRDRTSARQACIDYLNGNLQFLFIAPERLRVPGFPEMLAKRKPSLIAIDEAHCISQWGHDFRPDYRMLGQYLPTLRPAVVIAMTATATPLVQDDIAEQLGLSQAARFIHGFRRDNLAVEVIEVAPSQRASLTSELLQDDARRPAIVYAPTRAQATSLAAELASHFPCAAYHAGLDADRRKRVQEQFIAGRLEVMVATIAFGMGIDKPDVRTVIHTALPGSLEAYYQEIGRAGRDGKLSRTVLMHSYADRRTHDFFFERDYPDVKVLESIFARLTAEPQEKSLVQSRSRMEEDAFDKALEKLWIHGGAVVDFAENITRGHDHWRETYAAQGNQKQQQLDLMLRFAESNECRMAALVRHFGDFAGGREACGICDFCAPAECEGQKFRRATQSEQVTAIAVMTALRKGGGKTTGRLYTEINPDGGMTRNEFEDVLGAMARAGLVRLTSEVFEKDGKSIPYRKAAILDDREEFEILMKEAIAAAPKSRKGKKKKKEARGKYKREQKTLVEASATLSAPRSARPSAPPDAGAEAALRAWRLAEAKRRGVPAFRIFSDKTLHALALVRPETAAELIAIPGIGISIVEKYGAQLYRVLHGDRA